MNEAVLHSFAYRGVDMSQYNVMVEDFDFPESAVPSVNVIDSIQGDAFFDPLNDQVRSLVMNVGVWAHDKAQFDANMRALKRLTDSSLDGPGILAIDAYDDRDFYGVRSSPIVIPPMGRIQSQFAIEFLIAQHDWGRTLQTGSAAFTSGAPTVDLGTIEGDHFARVLWYIQNDSGSDVTGTITLSSDTLATEKIEWTGTLENQRWLKLGSFDADKQYTFTIEKSTAGGADPNALSYIDARVNLTDGIHPSVRGAVQNIVRCTGLSAGNLQWEYYARF